MQPGTYFYHGHYGMQRAAGLYGSLIVDLPSNQSEPFHYDGEFNLLLSDLWHTRSHEQEVGLSSAPMRWVGEPQVYFHFLIKNIMFIQFTFYLFMLSNLKNSCIYQYNNRIKI